MKAGLSKAVKDHFNRLAAISTSDGSKKQSHTFGVSGFRRKKKDKNDVETTEYAAGLATAVSKATGGETITYLMGHRIMGFERSSDGAAFYFICDSLSTVRDLVNSSGSVVASYEFAEYGQKISPANTGGVESQKTFVGGLSVQDEVADTGLMMMGHRFYDPGLMGRFLNRDPIGFSGGLNPFEYSNSRPVSSTDPAGLNPNDTAGWVNSRPQDASSVSAELMLERMLDKANMTAWKPIVREILGENTILWGEHEGADGWSGRDGFIYLDRSLSPFQRGKVLFHEVLHKAADKASAGHTVCGIMVPERARGVEKIWRKFEVVNRDEADRSNIREEMWAHSLSDLLYVKYVPPGLREGWRSEKWVEAVKSKFPNYQMNFDDELQLTPHFMELREIYLQYFDGVVD